MKPKWALIAAIVVSAFLATGCGGIHLALDIGGQNQKVEQGSSPDTILAFDMKVLAGCAEQGGTVNEQQVCAENRLVRVGVKPKVAAIRILNAMNFSRTGQK